uniref:Uncharacterized protein n=1 Tax=Arundo donax TaxID=35708 RepID=A0A0A9D2C2_ARUDO
MERCICRVILGQINAALLRDGVAGLALVLSSWKRMATTFVSVGTSSRDHDRRNACWANDTVCSPVEIPALTGVHSDRDNHESTRHGCGGKVKNPI